MLRAMDKWLMGYLRSVVQRPRVDGLRHLIFCVADHFEPFRGGASEAEADQLVKQWQDSYAGSVEGFRDSDGVSPQHTFFYPAEDYAPAIIDRLASLCAAGHGEVEVHLHHRHDTPVAFRSKLTSFRDTLRERHGLLGSDADGRPVYAFIHGNWALCNSRPDGDWCGVNDELGVLSGTGCYADLTFPSAPSPTQPRTVNAIYRASDTGRPRAADYGKKVSTKKACAANLSGSDPLPLLLIQGPLALNWSCRKFGLIPRVENGEITGANPPRSARVDLWARQHIHVGGRPDWVFVKVHTHGCVADNAAALLGPAMRRMHEHLAKGYADGRNWRLHYVTAREMFNIVRAAEDARSGDPGEHRDYEITRPPVCSGGSAASPTVRPQG